MLAEIMIVLKRIKPKDFPLIAQLLNALCEWRRVQEQDSPIELQDTADKKLKDIFDLIDDVVYKRTTKRLYQVIDELKKLNKEE